MTERVLREVEVAGGAGGCGARRELSRLIEGPAGSFAVRCSHDPAERFADSLMNEAEG